MFPKTSFKISIGLSFAILTLLFSILISQEALAVGLKVNVKLSHSNNGLTKVCVNSVYQNLGCRTITLSGLPNPYTLTAFIFGENVLPVGGQFKACATNVATNAYRCATGTNSPAKLPEYVSGLYLETLSTLMKIGGEHVRVSNGGSYIRAVPMFRLMER